MDKISRGFINLSIAFWMIVEIGLVIAAVSLGLLVVGSPFMTSIHDSSLSTISEFGVTLLFLFLIIVVFIGGYYISGTFVEIFKDIKKESYFEQNYLKVIRRSAIVAVILLISSIYGVLLSSSGMEQIQSYEQIFITIIMIIVTLPFFWLWESSIQPDQKLSILKSQIMAIFSYITLIFEVICYMFAAASFVAMITMFFLNFRSYQNILDRLTIQLNTSQIQLLFLEILTIVLFILGTFILKYTRVALKEIALNTHLTDTKYALSKKLTSIVSLFSLVAIILNFRYLQLTKDINYVYEPLHFIRLSIFCAGLLAPVLIVFLSLRYQAGIQDNLQRRIDDLILSMKDFFKRTRLMVQKAESQIPKKSSKLLEKQLQDFPPSESGLKIINWSALTGQFLLGFVAIVLLLGEVISPQAIGKIFKLAPNGRAITASPPFALLIILLTILIMVSEIFILQNARAIAIKCKQGNVANAKITVNLRYISSLIFVVLMANVVIRFLSSKIHDSGSYGIDWNTFICLIIGILLMIFIDIVKLSIDLPNGSIKMKKQITKIKRTIWLLQAMQVLLKSTIYLSLFGLISDIIFSYIFLPHTYTFISILIIIILIIVFFGVSWLINNFFEVTIAFLSNQQKENRVTITNIFRVRNIFWSSLAIVLVSFCFQLIFTNYFSFPLAIMTVSEPMVGLLLMVAIAWIFYYLLVVTFQKINRKL